MSDPLCDAELYRTETENDAERVHRMWRECRRRLGQAEHHVAALVGLCDEYARQYQEIAGRDPDDHQPPSG